MVDALDGIGGEIHLEQLGAALDDAGEVRRRGVEDPEHILLVRDDALNRDEVVARGLAGLLVPRVQLRVRVRDERAVGGDFRHGGRGLVDPARHVDEPAAGGRDGDARDLLRDLGGHGEITVPGEPAQELGGIVHHRLGIEHRPDVREPFAIQREVVMQRVDHIVRRGHFPDAAGVGEIDGDVEHFHLLHPRGDAGDEVADGRAAIHGGAADRAQEFDLRGELDTRKVARAKGLEVLPDDVAIDFLIEFCCCHSRRR